METKWIIRKPIVSDNWTACLQTLEGHGSLVSAVAWSHDSTRLASVSDDKTVKIWDPATGQCVSTLDGHGSRVTMVAWSHDSTRLASASYDNTVKIWDPATGQCVSTLQIGDSINNLQIHKSYPNVLHTEHGIFDFRHVVDLTLGPVSADCLSPEVVGYGLSSNNTWITYQGENLIWLPPEYRPSASAVSGTTVSIGCPSGRVLIIEFSEWDPTL